MQVHTVKRTSTATVMNFPLTTAVNLQPMKICLCRRSLATSMSSFDLKCTRRTESPLCRGSILWELTPSVVFSRCFKAYRIKTKSKNLSHSLALNLPKVCALYRPWCMSRDVFKRHAHL